MVNIHYKNNFKQFYHDTVDLYEVFINYLL